MTNWNGWHNSINLSPFLSNEPQPRIHIDRPLYTGVDVSNFRIKVAMRKTIYVAAVFYVAVIQSTKHFVLVWAMRKTHFWHGYHCLLLVHSNTRWKFPCVPCCPVGNWLPRLLDVAHIPSDYDIDPAFSLNGVAMSCSTFTVAFPPNFASDKDVNSVGRHLHFDLGLFGCFP